jgi:heptosyltransferase-1
MPRILLIKTSSMGDVIHNLPIVNDIRRHRPDARFDWVVEESFADIPRLHPAVDDVIPVAIRRWRRALFAPPTWAEMKRFRERLRAQPYDLALDTQGLLKSAVITRLAGRPSWGLDAASAREPLAARFYHHHCGVPWGHHAVWRNRALAACVFDYPIPTEPPDYGIAAPSLPPDLPAKYLVCLHATSWDSKHWPARHWVDLCGRLMNAGLVSLLPWGSEAEHERAQAIARAVPGTVVLPRSSLRTLAGIIGNAQAVVGVDTGLVHLAAALGRPTVALYTDTDPILTGVVGAAATPTLNLGGKGCIPAVEEVWQTFVSMRLLATC